MAEQGLFPVLPEARCTHCREIKPTTEFYPSKTAASGRHPWCKPCTRAYNREYIKRNPEANAARARKSRIKAIYGITWQQRDQMIADQDHRCAICREPFTDSKTTHQDHCHKSDKLRGILCYSCNTGLGNFKDSPQRLAAAIEYLRRYQE